MIIAAGVTNKTNLIAIPKSGIKISRNCLVVTVCIPYVTACSITQNSLINIVITCPVFNTAKNGADGFSINLSHILESPKTIQSINAINGMKKDNATITPIVLSNARGPTTRSYVTATVVIVAIVNNICNNAWYKLSSFVNAFIS